jgi:hypothetical protein
MSNAFTQFLSGFAGGLFGNDGYLRDYKHAARLYQDNYYGMAPKAGWTYFVEIGLNPKLHDKTIFATIDDAWYKRSRGKLGLLAKTADLPRFTVATETLNQYNKKTVVQSKITYNPVSITFHDDMDNIITDLWKNYYQYYYADSRYTGFNSLSKTMAQTPEAYQPSSEYDNRAYAYGLNNGQTDPFFSYIKIFLLNRRKHSSVTLVNPIITEWAHSQLDQTNGNKLLDAKMTVAYEAVYYDTQNSPVTKTEPGFNAIHYDNAPSPLSVYGGGGKGLSGLLNGSADILGVFDKEGPLSVGDILNVAIGTKNLVQNARTLTSAGIKQEAYSLVTSSLVRAATNPASSTISINQIELNGPNAGQTVARQVNPINAIFTKPVSLNETVATPRNLGGN